MDIEKILKELTREEKAALVAGTRFMYTVPVPRLGIPSVRMSDGPHGLRVQLEGGDNGCSRSEPATCFPTAATMASSWNPENTYKVGKAMAEEARHFGINVILGPGVNIKRNPLGGRCFEYFSEDPRLAGEMGLSQVRGIEELGVGVALKHFALNSSENYRFLGDSVADMRAIREIYLKPFEIIVKGGAPETLMCAYNKINGEFCCQNKWLLTDTLREEWGFRGLVMTDWGATHDKIKMIRSGLDLEMPGDTAVCRKWIVDALASGELSEEELDKAVRNVLTLVGKHENDKSAAADFEAHHELARLVALDSAVLLRNRGMLPLSKEKQYFITGELFEKTRYQGSGSSMINPTRLSTPKGAFDEAGISYKYSAGYAQNEIKVNEGLIKEALSSAEGCEEVLIFAGLTDYVESEGVDRENMRLPENQLALIDAFVKAGKQITVVLYGGSPAELPFADDVNAILNMYLPGQNGGEAARELLFGDASPAGRLAESWPISYSDVPFGSEFGKTPVEVYKESVFVGYRYYLSAGKKVRYPFGFGLSYTSFEYANMSVEYSDGKYIVSCDITNTGDRDGAEVVQLYVGAPGKKVFAPLRELKGFSKVYLKAKEKRRVEITLDACELKYYDPREKRPVTEGGEYRFELASDCESVKLTTLVAVEGDEASAPYTEGVLAAYKGAELSMLSDAVFEEMAGLKIPELPKRRPIVMDSRFVDLKATPIGWIIYNCIMMYPRITMLGAKRLPRGVERDNRIKGAIFLRRIMDSITIITSAMTSGGSCPYNVSEAIVNLANGRIIKGIKNLLSPVKAPALPEETESENT